MVDTIRTTAELQEIFKDGQPANSITANDVRDLVVTIPHITQLGWQFFFDVNAVDEGSAKIILEDVRTVIEIAPFLSEDLLYPPQSPLAWNSGDDEDGSGILNRINPQLLNGFGLIRISFAAWQNSPNSTFDLNFDVGSTVASPETSNIIFTETGFFSKGTGFSNHQHFNFIMPLFLGVDFSTNGGRFYVTPAGGNINCFNITLTLTNTFAPNPADL